MCHVVSNREKPRASKSSFKTFVLNSNDKMSFNFSIIAIVNVFNPSANVLFAWKSGLDPITWIKLEITKQITFRFRSKTL